MHKDNFNILVSLIQKIDILYTSPNFINICVKMTKRTYIKVRIYYQTIKKWFITNWQDALLFIYLFFL